MDAHAFTCGLCMHQGLVPFLPLGTLQRETFTTVLLKCPRCGILGDNTSLKYLKENSGSFSEFQASAVQKVYAKDLDMTAIAAEVDKRMPLASNLADRLPSSMRNTCYDFGCGSGLLACALTHQFEHVYATDLDPSLAEAIFEGIDADVTFATFEELRAGMVDLVVAWHVVEHLPRPHDFFEKCWRVLGTSGQVILQVPLPMPQYLEDDHLWFLTIESAKWIQARFKYSDMDYAVDEANQFITYFFTK
jgi:cyclopropane fatty-acyl-phospholipid synthase-like methyltransferase